MVACTRAVDSLNRVAVGTSVGSASTVAVGTGSSCSSTQHTSWYRLLGPQWGRFAAAFPGSFSVFCDIRCKRKCKAIGTPRK